MVVTSQRVLAGMPIVLVAHMYSGDWQFMDDSDKTEDDLVAVHYADILGLDEAVAAVSDLPRGYVASRPEGGEWLSRQFWSDHRIQE
jgi:hypothetical protein